mmetsp:Transcript_10133/g.7604  ORF Transcript_10133/g.7604 Transcript_10133/m.7604 type:complete len:240 (+) Transcript_10133:916-1635(+)|eukprot:CAMPEP_0202968860 /NCGR_PEP_ID=MMETSP1396-20130829/14341_1 /ASSEMBLY_ACC=CAM_ASM_000872 /TAXON_ID= /ORGANISM="Pseudokeronopsis sp., Strain Brazil" /LENGTH=239 /DNA_ID=CAMNT_0049695681 /DNA_START=682 /DNA_END=1401 /DNA_ORIENTATION=-
MGKDISADNLADPYKDKQNVSLMDNESQIDIHNRGNVSAINATTFQQNDDMSFSVNQFGREEGMPAIQFSKGIGNKNGAGGGLRENIQQVGLESGKACRICLEEEEEGTNPFITPCKCTGSMRYIHLLCLRNWLDSKRVSQKLEGVYSYYWEELVCELCKEPLSLNNNSTFGGSRRQFYLLNFKHPKPPTKYMVLESDIECLSKAIHVVILGEGGKYDYNVGRRITNDITVSDISVSRK